MQIQNNYHAYSGGEHQKSHTYSMPEASKDPKTGTGTRSGEKGGRALSLTGEKETDAFTHAPEGGQRQEKTAKKGSGALRKLWDAMGDEPGQGNKAPKEGEAVESQREIYGISEVFRQFFFRPVTVRWEEFKDRVKAGADVAFQNFEKKKDDFFALADPKSHFRKNFRKKREEKQKSRELAEKRARRQKEILTADAESHLMDSYSKSGEYCKLNDNLAYRRERMEENRRTFSERKS